jgi:stage II sporulation protein D
LKSIQDGEQPFCSIAPKFYWTEEFPESLFISRLFDAKLIANKNYSIISLDIKSRFESGRVKELNISLIDSSQITKNITLLGNGIRGIIKTSDGKSILRSTFFDISLDGNNKVIISGKGYGHGVGLCQWGAIGQSRQGIDYQTILKHYFPGTKISN